MKKTSILYITDSGLKLAQRLQEHFPGADIVKFNAASAEKLWETGSRFVFIMASGIVVRTIAPLLKDKKSDPAVVVLDEEGRFAISLAGGHLGGANDLARDIARFLEGEAVITTASDVNGLPSIDLWARDNDLIIENWDALPAVATRYVNNGGLRVYHDVPLDLPHEFLRVVDPRFADVIITSLRDVYTDSPRCSIIGEGCSSGACRVKGQLYLRPLNLVAGIGCNSGTSFDEIGQAVRIALDENNLTFASLAALATIDLKAEEPGLKSFVEKNGLPLRTFRPDELNAVEGVARSEAVFKATGAHAVAEPAALLAAGTDKLLVPKQKKGNVTVAVAEMRMGQRAECREQRQKGKIYIVGTGPGSLDHITPAAREAIRKSDVIVGYGTYLDLIQDLLQDKEVVSTGMTREKERCSKAVELALSGRTVAVISGGDPGVYAMAGLVLETLKEHSAKSIAHSVNNEEESRLDAMPSALCPLRVEVVPGISALNAAASRLGAPLMHDFACISLSDRLTPWERIEKRLEAAAEADFVIVLYNPRSKGRAGHLNKAREIVLRHRGPETVVGIVKGAMRENETVIVTDLANMQDTAVDMQTTVIIGNSKTYAWNDLMITPRGYDLQVRGEG